MKKPDRIKVEQKNAISEFKEEIIVNSIVVRLICEILIGIIAVIVAIVSRKKEKNIIMVFSIVVAVLSFVSTITINTVSPPNIDRKKDYSAVVIETNENMKVEYKVSTNSDSSNEWIEYKGPFKLKKSAIIYARAKSLWYTSETVYRNAYVEDNGLIYFSGAEKPGESIISLDAKYNRKDPYLNKRAGNHYVGYEIKKDDISVVGTTINGQEKKISNFSYSPRVLKEGKNVIKVEYSIADDISIASNMYVIGDEPALIKLNAKHKDGNVYANTELEEDDFTVNGTYEDGTVKDIKGYSISPKTLQLGKNTITISKDGLYSKLELNAVDRDTITETEKEPNDDLDNANEINPNIKYKASLNNEEDVDYYILRLSNRGKVKLVFNHTKIDSDDTYWKVSLLKNEDSESIIDLESSGANAKDESNSIRVESGTYYIKVYSDYDFSDEYYYLTASFQKEGDGFEVEPNEDLSSENINIITNKKYTGNLSSSDDIDYYKFTIKGRRKVWIDFTHEKHNDDDNMWQISLLDDSDDPLLEFTSNGGNAKVVSDKLRLPSGSYYIKVEPDYWNNSDYSFFIHSKKEKGNVEKEDNDDYPRATKINLNSSVIGNVQNENDIDYYMFILKSRSSVSISFKHQKTNETDNNWEFSLYSSKSDEAIYNKEDYSEISVRGDSPKVISRWKSLKSGIYYIKVKAYYYNNMDYSIKVKSS